MSDEFVRKDVFDAKVETLRVMLESTNKRLDDARQDISNLRDTVNRGWAIVGVVIALATFAFTAVQVYLTLKGV